MRAFISSIVLLVLISVAAAFGLNEISTSSQDAYTASSNVRH